MEKKTIILIIVGVIILVTGLVFLIVHFVNHNPSPGPGPSGPLCTSAPGGPGIHQLCAPDTSQDQFLKCFKNGNPVSCTDSSYCQLGSACNLKRPTSNTALIIKYTEDAPLLQQTNWYIGFSLAQGSTWTSSVQREGIVGLDTTCRTDVSNAGTGSYPGNVCTPSNTDACRTVSDATDTKQIGTFSPALVPGLGTITMLTWYHQGGMMSMSYQGSTEQCTGCSGAEGVLCAGSQNCSNCTWSQKDLKCTSTSPASTTCPDGNTERVWWRLSDGTMGEIKLQVKVDAGVTKSPPQKIMMTLELDGKPTQISLTPEPSQLAVNQCLAKGTCQVTKDLCKTNKDCAVWYTYSSEKQSYTYGDAKKWLGKTVNVTFSIQK